MNPVTEGNSWGPGLIIYFTVEIRNVCALFFGIGSCRLTSNLICIRGWPRTPNPSPFQGLQLHKGVCSKQTKNNKKSVCICVSVWFVQIYCYAYQCISIEDKEGLYQVLSYLLETESIIKLRIRLKASRHQQSSCPTSYTPALGLQVCVAMPGLLCWH